MAARPRTAAHEGILRLLPPARGAGAAAAGLLLLLLPACTDRELPTAPAQAGEALHSVSDAVHDGTEGFYFLPPMVEDPAYDGTFDPGLDPVVEICETAACDALHARFSTTEGTGSTLVRLVEADEHYIVNWHSGQTGAAAGGTYRVRVVVGDVVLGHADVAVVGTGRDAASVRAAGSIALVAGRTLPVKARIETGIVGAVVVSPAEAIVDVGGAQPFSAALRDLHGEPLAGPEPTWSSDDAGVATVDADGLATGVGPGAAIITARAGPASGSARLTVRASGVLLVNTTDDADDGTCDAAHCSLREAIEASNAAPSEEEIRFGIPGPGPHTIRPASLLPAIVDPVVVDGYTQAGARPNTNGPGEGSDAVLMVEIDGSEADDASWGLRLWSDDSMVRGLVVNGFDEGVQVAFGDRNRVQGSFIGTDVTGTAARPNGNGVRISAGAEETVVGTDGDGIDDAAERNLISGNGRGGVHISQGSLDHVTDRNVVAGNLIGTDVTGARALPNGWGVSLISQTNENRIGTDGDGVADEAERNVISGNVREGVHIQERPPPIARPHRTIVAGNYIGTDAAGTGGLGNGGAAVAITRSPDNVVDGNLLSGNGGAGVRIVGSAATGNRVVGNRIGTDAGGDAPMGNEHGVLVLADAGATVIGGDSGANIIAHNRGDGVRISAGTGNAVLDNAVFENGGLAIDLGGDGVTPNDAGDVDEGPNRLQNFPVLTQVVPGPGTLAVAGTLESAPGRAFALRFYAGPCDASGHGEARRLVGEASVTTDASGLAAFGEAFDAAVADDAFVSATATDEDGNTSELSRCLSASARSWHSMGTGMDGPVLALAVYEGDVIAGGAFTTAGGQAANHIARWDGAAWRPLGTGMDGDVHALAVHDGELIAGGAFTTADGQAANRIARWDGSAWRPMSIGAIGSVRAITVHDGDLIAGGTFSSGGGEIRFLARWDGSVWQRMATVNGPVHALTVHDGDLIAGGIFSHVDGLALHIARWDGSAWHAMGPGLGGNNEHVATLVVHGGDLIAGGSFTTAGGQAANRIARWDGSAWHTVGAGTNHTVFALAIHDGDLVAGGTFSTAGGEAANRTARWDGSAWHAMGPGMNTSVAALAVHGDDLIAGGFFGTAGGQSAIGIARWGTP